MGVCWLWRLESFPTNLAWIVHVPACARCTFAPSQVRNWRALSPSVRQRASRDASSQQLAWVWFATNRTHSDVRFLSSWCPMMSSICEKHTDGSNHWKSIHFVTNKQESGLRWESVSCLTDWKEYMPCFQLESMLYPKDRKGHDEIGRQICTWNLHASTHFETIVHQTTSRNLIIQHMLKSLGCQLPIQVSFCSLHQKHGETLCKVLRMLILCTTTIGSCMNFRFRIFVLCKRVTQYSFERRALSNEVQFLSFGFQLWRFKFQILSHELRGSCFERSFWSCLSQVDPTVAVVILPKRTTGLQAKFRVKPCTLSHKIEKSNAKLIE